jgi:A/G-specific adenine glycosylase
MFNTNDNKLISKTLINWYHTKKRDLPWRNITDPYKIWISEIILQQTRVNQGMNYYLRFIERFPTVIELAEASEDEVLKYWQGLGYYSRARNLHKAANQIKTNHGGVFPTQHAEVIKLAGIGEYTAAAICSFAYTQHYAVVDGNVYRVLSRIFGIETPIDSTSGKKEFAQIAQSLLSVNEPDTHNQAIMEFGALYCVPSSPDCVNCLLNDVCKAYKLSLVSQLPIKSQKTKVTHRFFNYFFIESNGNTFLQKRIAKDVWQNLYEFPLIETNHLADPAELVNNTDFQSLFNGIKEVKIIKTTNPMKHILSHRVIFARFFSLKISNENEVLKQFIKTPVTELDQFAISRLMELFVEQITE